MSQPERRWKTAELDRRVVVDDKGNVIADVHTWRVGDPELIAAAPEMYEALIGLRDNFGPKTMEAALAAIAKAEGK